MKKTIALLFTVCLIIFLLYLPLFHVPFLYDDFDFLFTWNAIHDFNHLPELLAGATPPYHEGVYRPIRGILYVLSYHFLETNLFAYHILEMGIYLGCMIFVFLITKIMTKNHLLSALTMLIFGILPLHIDNVANLTGSFDTIGVLFALVSFYLFQRYLAKKRSLLLLLSLLFSVFAYFTYEVTLALFLLVFLYAHFLKKKLSRLVLLLYIILPCIYLFLRFQLFHIGSRGYLLDQFPQKFAGGIETIWTYIVTALLPAPPTAGSLASFQGTLLFSSAPELPPTISHPQLAVPFIAVAFFTIGGIMLYKKRSLIGFGMCWFLVSLLAVLPIGFVSSSVYQTQLLWPRYAILATYGLSLMLASLFASFITASSATAVKLYFKLVGVISFSLLLAYYCFLIPITLAQWKDPRPELFTQIQKQPESSRKHNDLGVIKADYKQYGDALTEFDKAIVLDPTNKRAKRNLQKLCTEILPKTKPELIKYCKQ